ncbi:site-specific integrase [Actinomadura syzygii]|uniref:DNA-binding phage zinc finger domain-containing protein n=1 Tax=Actinomadura syzygii TaxID=1427538 RepID=A0A5D0U2F7_9ACTN|nr:site-specific integrase [Actinomadura syzygii]TYC11209.1 hypothetical protein FXF65_30180 [Actinomadura syzygii]
MAYVEKRGRYFRGRYRNPPGVVPQWGTVSADENGDPFTTRIAAYNAANDKEAQIRQLVSRWEGPPVEGVTLDQWKRLLAGRRRARGERNPFAGEITLRTWIETKWFPAQDIEARSLERYEQHLRLRILPTFGDLPINAIFEREEIEAWAIGLRRRYARSTVDNARNLLSTILGDACEGGLLDVNAAARRRRRGKMVDQRAKDAEKPRPWVTPLQALLIAERCAVLTGRDDDFVMWTVCAWCGLRWGELMGLQRHHLRGDTLAVETQLDYRAKPVGLRAPKEGSYRNDNPHYFGAVDLPPFLMELFARHVIKGSTGPCGCPCGGEDFLFLNPRGGHHGHRGYADFPWLPAAAGVHPARRRRPGRARGAQARPVLVNMVPGWPGRPLRPAWPAATGPDWSPPRVQGIPRYDLPIVDDRAVDCPRCGALAGEPCIWPHGSAERHRPRRAAAAAAGHVQQLELASWLPIAADLTPHGFRHSQRVWLDDVGTSKVLTHDRLGHALPGIGGTYAHVSPFMRQQLRERFQALWEQTLEQRRALSPASLVPALNDLLLAA